MSPYIKHWNHIKVKEKHINKRNQQYANASFHLSNRKQSTLKACSYLWSLPMHYGCSIHPQARWRQLHRSFQHCTSYRKRGAWLMLELLSLWRKDSLWRGFLVSAGGVICPEDVLGDVGAEVVLSTAAVGSRRCTVSWTAMFLFPPWGDMVGQMDSPPHGRGSFVARIGSSADLQHSSTDWSAGGWVRDLGVSMMSVTFLNVKFSFLVFFHPQVSPAWTEQTAPELQFSSVFLQSNTGQHWRYARLSPRLQTFSITLLRLSFK